MRIKKIPRQNVLFMHAAPSSAENEMVIVCRKEWGASRVVVTARESHAQALRLQHMPPHHTFFVFFSA